MKKFKKSKKYCYQLKISLFSKDEKIQQQFLKAIKAKFLNPLLKKDKLGANLAHLTYRPNKTNEKYLFRFWSICNKSKFDSMIYSITLDSFGIIFFYQDNEEIEENRLKLIKNEINPKITILFVRYDSISSKKPERSYDNIQLIKKYYNDYISLKMSFDKPDSLFHILDRIIDIYFCD